jgi:hypothetical protein
VKNKYLRVSQSSSENQTLQNKTSNLKSIMLLLGVAFVLNLGFSLSGFYNWNYDSWAHMFFASHYMNSWFDTWDVRWFGGMSVTSYPPLVTQLLALVGFVTGLEYAYIILNILVMMAIPIAVYYFSCCFLPQRQATWAGLFAIFLPSIYLASYTYGQLPTLFALVSTLFMGTFLCHYLKNGDLKAALIAALLFGITAAFHQFTFICLVPGMIAVTGISFILSRQTDTKVILKRLVIFGLISLPLALIPIFPFWQFLIHATPQTPIPHITREFIFANSNAFWMILVAPYLLFLLAIPLAFKAAIRNKILIPILILFLLLFILGLGSTTPLPKLIFGGWWQWLIYDRFALWAGIVLLPLVAKTVTLDIFELGKKLARPAVNVFIAVAFIAMYIGISCIVTNPLRYPVLTTIPNASLKILVEFLDTNAGDEYRYITLGLGEAQVEKISAMTKSSSLDGGYYTARTLPVLTESGIGTIDSIKYVDPELTALDTILAEADSYNLKWILVNDIFYNDILEKNGFILHWSAEKAGDNRLGSITIWGKNGIPPIAEDDNHETGFGSMIWGIAPIGLVVALILLLLKKDSPKKLPYIYHHNDSL